MSAVTDSPGVRSRRDHKHAEEAAKAHKPKPADAPGGVDAMVEAYMALGMIRQTVEHITETKGDNLELVIKSNAHLNALLATINYKQVSPALLSESSKAPQTQIDVLSFQAANQEVDARRAQIDELIKNNSGTEQIDQGDLQANVQTTIQLLQAQGNLTNQIGDLSSIVIGR